MTLQLSAFCVVFVCTATPYLYPVLSFLTQLQFGARYLLSLLVTLQLSALSFVLFCQLFSALDVSLFVTQHLSALFSVFARDATNLPLSISSCFVVDNTT